MEFEIDLKLMVNIKDIETNVNEIAGAVKEGMRDMRKEILKMVLRVYQLSVRESLLRGECSEDKILGGGDGEKGCPNFRNAILSLSNTK